MLMLEYDYDTDIAVQREEAEQIGEERGIQIGEARGEERGIQIGEARGEERGMIYGIIETCLSLNMSNMDILAMIQNNRNISASMAEKYFEDYVQKMNVTID